MRFFPTRRDLNITDTKIYVDGTLVGTMDSSGTYRMGCTDSGTYGILFKKYAYECFLSIQLPLCCNLPKNEFLHTVRLLLYLFSF